MLSYVYRPKPSKATDKEKKEFKKGRDIYMYHDCLTSWQELDNNTQGYDCAVVDTSFKLYYEDLKKNDRQRNNRTNHSS